MKKERRHHKHSAYLTLLEDDIAQAAEKAGISLSEGKELLDEFFLRLKNILSDPRAPTVSLPRIGFFRPSFYQISRRITHKFFYYRLGSLPKFLVDKVIGRYWKIYKRMIEEKYGKNQTTETSQLWNNIDPTEFKRECIEGIHTKLPENYNALGIDAWIKFIFSEARCKIGSAPLERAVGLYNGAVRRLNEAGATEYQKITFKVGGRGRPPVAHAKLIKQALEFVEEYDTTEAVYNKK